MIMERRRGEAFGSARSPAYRLICLALGICSVALGIVISPISTGQAHASQYLGETKLFSHWTDSSGASWQVTPSGSTVGSGMQLTKVEWPYRQHPYSVHSHPDGTITITERDNGLCLDIGTSSEQLILNTCNNSSSQSWYLQYHQALGAGVVRIRHTNDDKCMNIWGGDTKNYAKIGLYGCQAYREGSGGHLDLWHVDPRPEYQQVADQRALMMFDRHSTAVPSAQFQYGSSTLAGAGPAEMVSVAWHNNTSAPSQQTLGWSDTTGYTYTNGGSVTATLGLEFGGEKSPVKASFSVAVTGYWGNAWSTSQTVSSSSTFTVNPGQVGWVARGQLLKSATGTWTIKNDVGDTWTATGVATVPVANGTDGKGSQVALCTSDGEKNSDGTFKNALCQTTRKLAGVF
ncbi:RICIN domain-containing protein [Streptomyces syringium]|uniref:RICIN domain-containing protein n=1 Tax=Streptomyces syringium TaxID=76729 RepID=UPI00344430AF